MGFSTRVYLVGEDHNLYRLPNSTLEKMLRDPDSHPLVRFAGTGVRMTEVIVELVERQAIRVVQTSFSRLSFDARGFVEPGPYYRQQHARAEVAVVLLAAGPPKPSKVVDAAVRFVAQGGRWAPSPTLARRIEDVALGRVICARL